MSDKVNSVEVNITITKDKQTVTLVPTSIVRESKDGDYWQYPWVSLTYSTIKTLWGDAKAQEILDGATQRFAQKLWKETQDTEEFQKEFVKGPSDRRKGIEAGSISGAVKLLKAYKQAKAELAKTATTAPEYKTRKATVESLRLKVLAQVNLE